MVIITLFFIVAFLVFAVELTKQPKLYYFILIGSFVVPLRLTIGDIDIYTFDFPLVGLLIRLVFINKKIRLYKYDLWLIAFVIVAILSSAFSVNTSAAFFDAFAIVRAMSVVFIFRGIDSDKSLIRGLTVYLMYLIVFESTLAFIQYFTGSYIGSLASMLGGAEEALRFASGEDPSMFRVRGTFSYDTSLGMFYILTLPVCFGLWLLTKKSIFAIVLLCGLGGLLLTFTRTAWISTAFAMGLVILYMSRYGYINMTRIVGISAVAAPILAAIVLMAFPGILDLIYGRFFGSSSVDTVEMRMILNAAALSIFQGDVVFGIGFGNFGHYLTTQFGFSGLDENTAEIIKAHNVFVALALESGVLGLITFSMWLATPIIKSMFARNTHTFVLCLVAPAVLGVVMQNQGAWTMLNPSIAVSFWAFFGILQARVSSRYG